MAGTTIPSGATLKQKWFATDGAILRRNGANLESYPIADLYAAIQAAITAGTIPVIIKSPNQTSYQISVANDGTISSTAV